MNTGQIISAAAHAGLIGWVLLGNVLASDPPPFEVTSVTAISADEYAALVSAEQSPAVSSDVETPDAPEVPQEAPAMDSQTDAAPERPQSPETEALAPDAAPDSAPDVSDMAPPPEAEITDEAPVLLAPQPEIAALPPDASVRPRPRPAKRVAPEQVAPPEQDVKIDDVDRPETQPDEAAETPEPEQEATAREEAATEIVTEAEQPAPSKSVRPKARPDRPTPTQTAQEKPAEAQAAEQQPAPETPEAAPDSSGGIMDALAEAGAGSAPEAAPASSRPNGGLSDNQLSVLIRAIGNEWAVDPGARSAAAIVTVLIRIDANGNLAGTPELLTKTGGDPAAQAAAFRSARTAIIAAARAGAFKVFAEVDSDVHEIEMTFNPESMRIR